MGSRGPQPVPRRTIADGFKNAVFASPRTLRALAVLSYFSHPGQLSAVLHRDVRVTDLALPRLRILAALVDYDGPLFQEDDGPDAFTTTTVPSPHEVAR